MSDGDGDDRKQAVSGGTATVGDWTGRLPADKSRAVREHRVQQGLWRTTVAHWPAGEPQADQRVRARYATLPNWLAESHAGESVVDAGINLMSPEARSYTRERLPVLERTDGKAETDRLWRNLLSSQPMAFSIAGHLHGHKEAGAAVLGALTGLPVAALTRLEPGDAPWSDHLLDGIEAEWFPPRSVHTGDMSGCDMAACLVLDDGRRVLLSVEVKYTDTFSPKPVSWPRYEEHLVSLGLDEAATAELVSVGCSQALRQVMLTNSVVRRGLVPGDGLSGGVDLGIAVVFAREDDEVARRVAKTLDDAVGDRIPVRFWSHRDLFQVAADREDLHDWATAMMLRYLPDASPI